jgi:tetratricopeptide (TPR) repeat protein
VALQFFLYPAMAMVIANEKRKTQDEKRREKPAKLEWWQYGSIALFVLCSLFFVLRLAQFWYADVLYARGSQELKQGYPQEAFQILQRATSLNPNEPVIHSELGYAAALLAQIAHQQEEDELRDQLINVSISQSSQSLMISTRNLNFWKNRVKSFYALAEIDPKFLQPALESLLEAIKLAPTDAKLWYNLGILYTKLEQPEEAIETLEKTVEIKKNYQSARYALALLYEDAGRREEALEQTEYILTYINSSVPEVRELYKKLTGKEFGAE